MTKGTKIRTNYGKVQTVIEVIDNLMIRTYEDYNNLVHISNIQVIQ